MRNLIKKLKKENMKKQFQKLMNDECFIPVINLSNNSEELYKPSELKGAGSLILNLSEICKREIRSLFPKEKRNEVTFFFYN